MPELAPAKVNLYLHILGRRSDGYHELQSLVAFADFGDSVTVAARAPQWSLALDGPFAEELGETVADDNLVLRAARRLAAATPGTTPMALRLHKALPVAAGIGGGSADAAAAIRLLAGVWGGDPGPPAAWADLGADIPVCLVSQPSLVQGMGEQVAPVANLPNLPAVLVNPGVPSATAAVFRALAGRFGRAVEPPLPPDNASAVEIAAWLAKARNDLTRPAVAIEPAIGEVLAGIAAAPDVLLARMSGSGATCFGLFPSEAQAAAAALWLRARAPHWWIKQTVLTSNSATRP